MPITRKGWSTNKRSLGQPGSMPSSPSQGITSKYRGVVQGKFSGDARFATNLKQKAPEAAPTQAWPNKGTVYRPRLRYSGQ